MQDGGIYSEAGTPAHFRVDEIARRIFHEADNGL